MINQKTIKVFLRLALATAFLSAVADRFGLWPANVSAWGDWNHFLDYTGVINPWFPASMIPLLAIVATAAEIGFALCLLLGFKTEFVAKLSGIMLLIFSLSMTFSTGIKGAFDYSVFTASAAAFALSVMKDKYMEIDSILDSH